jgi:2-keto-4-pentenoate hydratase/2-oxohepta-3-ene-1,7-dioic acid hydratase in catechol pathway
VRLASVAGNPPLAFLVRGERMTSLAVASAPLRTLAQIVRSGPDGLKAISAWADAQPETSWGSVDRAELGPAVPEPGAIYAVGLNYAAPDGSGEARPERPLVYAKLPTSVAGHEATLAWDRSLTANVDAEVELGIVIGEPAWQVEPGDAMRHVFGYTIVDDVSSRDPWLDGDQWLLGKSMPGFCPVGPWIVTADELDPADLRLGCTINGAPIQDGRTSQGRFSIAEVISFLSRHVMLQPGDLIATGTPVRLDRPPGPDRHLRADDVVTAWIEGIGELTTRVA